MSVLVASKSIPVSTHTRLASGNSQTESTPNISVRPARYTTTFGIDDSGRALSAYKIRPKDIPGPLMLLKETIERMQNEAGIEPSSSTEQDSSSSNDGVRYNALIINYYATGDDSISYHADDEAFLGPLPNIASLSLGATRDFYLRRKAPEGVEVAPATSASGSKGSVS